MPADPSKRKCHACGSTRVSADGDMVEEIVHPDQPPEPTHWYGWWNCDECGYQWRYQNESLNPGAK